MAVPTRLVIVDDHRLFRDGLRTILSSHGEFAVVGEAEDARAGLLLADGGAWDLMIVDITLPGRNGLALIRELRRAGHKRPLLVLTMHQHADMVADAFDAGADGYALKHQSAAELIEALHTLSAGGRYVAPELEAAMTAASPGRDRGVLGALSAREREIFDLLVRGGSNAAIAAQLFISVKTVDTHRTRIMKKLGAHSIGELIRLAARHGLLPA